MTNWPVHAKIDGPIVMIGFGSIGKGTLPLIERQVLSSSHKRLRTVCTERNVVLIFDEVFVGFRLALGGAQEYFEVRADLVTYAP
jgi:homospermidine synthase